MAPVAVAHIRAKSRHLHGRGSAFRLFARLWFLHHHDDAELCTDGQAVREYLLNALWSGVSSNIVIGGFAVQQDVAHTTAHQIRLIPFGAQRPANVFRKCASVHAAIMRESRLGWKV